MQKWQNMIKFFNFLKKLRLYKILVLERVEILKCTLKYCFICKINMGTLYLKMLPNTHLIILSTLKSFKRLHGTKPSRMNQAKFVEYILSKIWRDMIWFSRQYPFKFFKSCLPHILFGSFLNTLSHMLILRMKVAFIFKVFLQQNMFLLVSYLVGKRFETGKIGKFFFENIDLQNSRFNKKEVIIPNKIMTCGWDFLYLEVKGIYAV